MSITYADSPPVIQTALPIARLTAFLSAFSVLASLSIPVHPRRNVDKSAGDSLGFGLCGFAARHIEVEHASVRHGIWSSRSPRRIRQIRYFAFSRHARFSTANSNEIAGRVFFDRVGSCPHWTVYFQSGGKTFRRPKFL